MPDVDLAELERYLKIYQENPDSRVFAPLADLYRRLGKIEEAERLCREGLRRHPYYAGGRVALAHVLLDKGDFEAAAEEATHVVNYYPDNLLARKILIRAQGALGWVEQARREFETLKVIAPDVASDPELERALVMPRSVQDLAESPESPAKSSPSGKVSPPPPPSRQRALAQARKVAELIELDRLRLKVRILESLIARL